MDSLGMHDSREIADWVRPYLEEARAKRSPLAPRLQIGRRRALRCASDCTGALKFNEDGSIDGSTACPVHLLLYGKAIIEEELGLVPPMHIDEAVFADYKLWADAPRGATVVALLKRNREFLFVLKKLNKKTPRHQHTHEAAGGGYINQDGRYAEYPVLWRRPDDAQRRGRRERYRTPRATDHCRPQTVPTPWLRQQ